MNKKNRKGEQKKGVFGHSVAGTVEQMVVLHPNGHVASWPAEVSLPDAFIPTQQQGKMCTYSDGTFDFIPKRQIEGRPENFSYEILNKTAHGEVRKYANTLVLKLKVNLAEGPSVMRQFDAEYLNLSNEVADQLYNQN